MSLICVANSNGMMCLIEASELAAALKHTPKIVDELYVSEHDEPPFTITVIKE